MRATHWLAALYLNRKQETPMFLAIYTRDLRFEKSNQWHKVLSQFWTATALVTFLAVVAMPTRAACNWNVDANSITTSTSDGLMMIRRLRNLAGSELTNGAIGPNAGNNASAIAQHIDANKANWDFNGDGIVDAASDGVIIARYLFGFRGQSLTAGIVRPELPGRSPAEIESLISQGCPNTPTVPACTPPLSLIDTAAVAPRVGNGTPASCTDVAIQSAVNTGGVVTFNCGINPVTIAIRNTIVVPPLLNTVIDGAGKVTLDGGGTARIMQLKNGNYRTNSNGLTLQRITLANGKAVGTRYTPPNPNNPACAYGYADGSGGAIEVGDARLHVIDVNFLNNTAATPGPDVGGGAIYAAGSLDLTIVGSRFVGNSGSNAGAVGLLQTNGRFFNSLFQSNEATGTGQNYAGGAAAGCVGVGHPEQGGAGGNGGAIAIDGSDDTDQIFCGTRIVNNTAGALAGAIFRTANFGSRLTTIDRSEISGNTAKQGGAFFISNSVPLNIVRSTVSNNSAETFGGAHFERSQLNIENSTFAGNTASNSLGGAIFQNDSASSSLIRNATFANNRITGGSGLFSAAIAGGINFPIRNTVFSNSTTNDIFNPTQCWFQPATGTNNVQWPRNRGSSSELDNLCVQDIVFADPLLGALGANGGPTTTLLPATNSPLIGAGRNCPATDQIGNVRSSNACTIGAVER
ncbi:MAG: hypothetical protein EAZ30_14785 [Betaproteobacteria bacterium]|nr:MAG: hypothetical protein EAZ30_14785 [Betaproteobacteria bacterium]